MNQCAFSVVLPVLFVAVAIAGKVTAANSEMDRSAAGGRMETVSSTDYVLLPQDMLRVLVFQEEDINRQGEVRISQEHTISLPLIGTISLKGKTVRQAEEMIRELYNRDYLVNPGVTVTVTKYAERSVNVLGAVNNAGRIFFPPERGLTIVDAISLAGGFSRLANLEKVKLTRKNVEGEPVTRVINVEEMMKGAGRDAASLSLRLEEDDTIFVPERIL